MTSLQAKSLADTCDPISTTSIAQRPPETEIEYDPAGVLLIRKGRSIALYLIDEFPVGGPGFDGRAFELKPDLGGEAYHVFLARNGQDSTCDCAGFTYTSNDPTGGRCKHLDAVKHLVETGQLEDVEAGRPVEPWPTPGQLNEAPF